MGPQLQRYLHPDPAALPPLRLEVGRQGHAASKPPSLMGRPLPKRAWSPPNIVCLQVTHTRLLLTKGSA